VISEGFVRDYPLSIRHISGPTTDVLYNATIYRNEAGKIQGVFAAARDITERKRAEKALQESEKKYREVVENATEIIYAVDEKGNFTYANPAGLKVTGYSLEELRGFNYMDLVLPEHRERVAETYVNQFRGKISTTHIEFPFFNKAGGITWFSQNATLVLEYERVVGFHIIARDITERKRAEEVLRESEARYRDLVETARDVIFSLSPQGMFTSFNSALETITGWSAKEWIGKVFVDLLDPNDVPKAIERFRTVMEGQFGEPIELRIRTKYGGVVHGEFVASPQMKEGKVIGILGVARDITERKKAEEALRQEKDFNQTLVQASPLFFVAIGPDGKTLMMNEAMLHALGYTTDEVQGKDYLSTFVPMADREIVLPIFQRLMNQKESTLSENRVLTKDGRELLVEWHGRPVFKANGDLDYFFGVGIDITQRKQVEEKMAALQEQLRQSQKIEAIGRLAGGVAHDFNNLLTVIKGYSQLSLNEIKGNDPLRENIEEIRKAADRAADLTRQLLAFSRRQILEMKVLDLNTVLRDLDKMLHRLIGEDIELTTLLADDLGRVKTDPGWVEQIIMNLAVNARDAMPNGGKLSIETANADLDEAYVRGHIGVKPGRYAMLSVSDTGVGMTPEVRERLFEPFFSTKEKDKGTGLGLSTVYGIVKQSGGDIRVYSEPGKGATFRIYLPRVDEPLDELGKKVSGDKLLRGKETILLVEDEALIRAPMASALEGAGFVVTEALTGTDALAAM
jgi:PAS domain S-box-containing protein